MGWWVCRGAVGRVVGSAGAVVAEVGVCGAVLEVGRWEGVLVAICDGWVTGMCEGLLVGAVVRVCWGLLGE